MRGQIDQLEQFAQKKSSLATKLEAAQPEDLRRLAIPLARNAALIKAAQDGVRQVLETLRKQRDARTSLSSYDKSGALRKIESAARQTDQRF
ncbi:MAG: hypothetical protein AAGL89_11350 [Pseudomonadota bacterium]